VELAELRALFASSKTIAVVGLSTNPSRPSYGVADAMQRSGFRIIPVNPRYAGEKIQGEVCVARLGDITQPVDIVDCFRRGDEMVEIARDAAAMTPRPRVLWMQLGVTNEQAATIAREAGLNVVQDRCIKIDYYSLR
jgi:uncharacterized protein